MEALQFVFGGEVVEMVGGALRGGKAAALQRFEKVVDKAKIEGSEPLVNLQRFEKVVDKAKIEGSEPLVNLQRFEKVVDKAKIEGSEPLVNLQRFEKVVDKAKIEGGEPLVNLQRFKEEVIDKAIINGSKGMVGEEFVYNVDYIVQIEKGVQVNIRTVFAEISRQAKEAGATSVRLNFNDIINDKLRKLFRTAKNKYGGKMMGWKVEGVTVWGGDVTLTKNL
jgi:hypothetical protein